MKFDISYTLRVTLLDNACDRLVGFVIYSHDTDSGLVTNSFHGYRFLASFTQQ